ncbi:MAG: alpha/beta fold hydrolase [Notoacmeibacter sp.]|nr:alpha/beta fold hydrolase [Notoacmeibacter sp.]MCC0031991.1 alpha/beta fold hydrolase [Brucellaceae bacterium]
MFLKLTDATLMVSAFGSGPRTIVAHGGWVGSGELWFPPFEAMSKSWRTITYDHRGTGASQHRAHAITFEHLVTDLFAVLDRLEVERCVLAGESAGAAVTLAAAQRQPHRFEGLVLVSPYYDGPVNTTLMEGCRTGFEATMDAFVDACVPEPECTAERAWGRKIVKRSTAKDAIDLMECMRDVDVTAGLPAMKTRALVLHGDKDLIRPVASSQALAKLIPGAKLSIAAGAGHVPTVTRPDWVVREIEDHFSAPVLARP